MGVQTQSADPEAQNRGCPDDRTLGALCPAHGRQRLVIVHLALRVPWHDLVPVLEIRRVVGQVAGKFSQRVHTGVIKILLVEDDHGCWSIRAEAFDVVADDDDPVQSLGRFLVRFLGV